MKPGIVALVALVSGGCSLLTAKGPPTGHEHMAYFKCSSGYAPPIIDSALLGAVALGGLSLAADDRALATQGKGPVIAGAAVMGAVYATSAVLGYQRVGACREAQKQLAARTPYPYLPAAGYPPPPVPMAPPPAPAQ